MNIVNIIVTWRLEALHQGVCEDCQCHRSKNIKGNKKESCLLTNMFGDLNLRVDQKISINEVSLGWQLSFDFPLQRWGLHWQ